MKLRLMTCLHAIHDEAHDLWAFIRKREARTHRLYLLVRTKRGRDGQTWSVRAAATSALLCRSTMLSIPSRSARITGLRCMAALLIGVLVDSVSGSGIVGSGMKPHLGRYNGARQEEVLPPHSDPIHPSRTPL